MRPNSVKKRCVDPQVGAPLSSGQTLNAVASDLGLTPESLRTWRKQMEGTPSADGAPATSIQTTSEVALAREVGQLRRELEAMTRLRDILKKAISIFSDDKSLSGGLR